MRRLLLGCFCCLLASQAWAATTPAALEKETADAWAELGNWKRAVEHYRKAVKLEPSAVEVRLRLANGLFRLGEKKEALEHLQKLQRAEPQSAAIACAIGVIQLDLGQPDRACRQFDAVLQREPDHDRALAGSGQCHQAVFERQGKDTEKQKAVARFQRYLERYPTGSQAAQARDALERLVLGAAGKMLTEAKEAVASGKFRAAEQTLRKLVSERPDLQEAQYLLGMALASPVLDRLDEARTAWQKAPTIKEAQLQLGTLAYEDGDFEDAAARFDKAIAIDKRYAEPYYQLGLVYLELANDPTEDTESTLAKARDALRQASELAADRPLGSQARSKLQLLEGNPQFLHESEVIDTAGELELGAKVAANLESKFGLLRDDKLQERLDRVLRAITQNAERLPGSLPYHIRVLDVDAVNALSLAGGAIYLYKGLVEMIRRDLGDSDDAFAIVIAHEVVHIDHRHGMGMLDLVGGARGLLRDEGLNVQSLNNLMIGIGRKYEYEADQIGCLYSLRAGFDPAAALRFHRLMVSSGREVPEGLDHPTHAERAARLKEYLLSLRSRARLFDTGLKELDADRPAEAARHFEIFLGLFPDNLAGRNNLGAAYHRQAMKKTAPAHAFKLSTDIDPRSRVKTIRVRAADGAFQPERTWMIEAAEQFRAVLHRQPDYRPARINLGASLLALGETAKAQREFEEALKADVGSASAACNLAVARILAGERQAGLEQLRRLVAENPTFADAHFNLARVLHEAGDRQGARAEYLAYLARDGTSGWAEAARAHLAELEKP